MSRNAHLTLAQFFQQAEKSILNVRKLLNLYSLASKMLEISRLRGFSLLFFADGEYPAGETVGVLEVRPGAYDDCSCLRHLIQIAEKLYLEMTMIENVSLAGQVFVLGCFSGSVGIESLVTVDRSVSYLIDILYGF